MTRPVGVAPLGPLRAGRLIEVPTGLIDLATGCPARLESQVVPLASAAAWHPSVLGSTGADAAEWCVDSWLTQDWLGRWVARSVHVRPWAVTLTAAPTDAGPEDEAWPASSPSSSIGVTRTVDPRDWCRLASRARASGVVPVLLTMLGSVPARTRLDWPPIVVGVPEGQYGADGAAALDAWVVRGGRIASVVRLCHVPADWGRSRQPPAGAGGLAPWRYGDPGQTAHARQVRRAWRALAHAPAWPTFIWVPAPDGGREGMTHLELLDVTAQLDDLRRDEDALAVACRAVRHHTRADHAAILASRGVEPQVLATDGPPGDSLLAWRQLCRADAPDALAASRGWHAAGRHALDEGTCVYVGACWSTRDLGETRQHLLPVFARLVAGRVPVPSVTTTAETPALEQTLVGASTVMQDVRAQIALAARAPFPVLIRGESGCGKELAARAIHALGQRRHRRCAALNCAALPDDLIESELFGHVRGAFTGAAADRTGLFDEADGGTLFLDEVGELGGRAQAKLLRVLQDGEVRRVGENQSRRVDVRVVAATNVSLEEAVRRGTFRADLFYRLDVVRVRMPALRERREDIPVLARHFWHDCTARVGSRARLEGRVLDVLARFDWPGNVRQLQNTLAALAVRVPLRGRVTVDDLPHEIRRPDASPCYVVGSGLNAARREFEATYVRDALTRAGGRCSLAARDLGLTRQGLSKLVRRLGLEEDESGSRLP